MGPWCCVAAAHIWVFRSYPVSHAHCPCSIFHVWIEWTERAVILHSDYCYRWHKEKKVYCVWWISRVLWRSVEIVELCAFSRYLLGSTQLPVYLLWNKKVTSNRYRDWTSLAPFGETLMRILRLNWCASCSSPFYIWWSEHACNNVKLNSRAVFNAMNAFRNAQ